MIRYDIILKNYKHRKEMLDELISLFGWSRATFFKWKREGRGIIKLIEKYFDEEMIHEFNTTGKIERLEKIKKKDDELKAIQTQIEDLAFSSALYKINNRVTPKAQKILIKIIQKIATDPKEYLDVKIHLIDNLQAVETTLDGDTKLSSFVLQNISTVEVEALIKYHHRIDKIKSH